MLKRIQSLVLVIVMGIVMNLSTECISAASNNSAANYDTTSENSNSENSYSKYLSLFKSNTYNPKNLRVELNGLSVKKEKVEFSAEVQSDGLYSLGISYKALDTGTERLKFGIQADGKYPYYQASEFELPRMWQDDNKERVDATGNEFAAVQVEYDGFYYNYILNGDSETGLPYTFFLTKGTHTISIIPISGEFSIEYFSFEAYEEPGSYTASANEDEYYSGKPIVIEGEDAVIKSNYFLTGKTDSSTVKVTPYNAEKNVINYIGGGNWKTAGDSIIWETPEVKAGYYQLGFSFRQNFVIGGKTYRSLSIDGKVPFAEAQVIDFPYDDNWQTKRFSKENGEPYLIYLSEGKHSIALMVVPGDISEVSSKLSETVSLLGDLYLDITMITGENVDIYRDYNLFSQIPDMEERLLDIKEKLNDSAEKLKQITGYSSGSNISVIKNMVEIINQMLNNRFEAHRYKSSYYSNYCSVSSALQEMRSMPLDIDKISLFSVNGKEPFEKTGAFEQIKYSLNRFITSFTRDYKGVSTGKDNSQSIKVWVNWGRDQAQVLSSLIERSFTPKTGINVNLQLVNVSMVQAVLSGTAPDCILQHSRSEPVNLAMRGVLYDLSSFSDCKDVLKRFQANADMPYRYNGGLYALPDTQNFFMMFYRKDILEKIGLSVPETWEDFEEAAKTLSRNNMTVWLPNNVATDAAQVNAGVGSNNIFPSLLLQNNISLYKENGKQTNLLSADVIEIFGKWTDYYNKLSLPLSLDFYNRFRIGTTPLGISTYSLYTTLKVAAPEIDGMWGITAIPGTPHDDGTVSHTTSGGGTGCAILKSSKSPDLAWEFLKWWTESDTQLTFSNDIESIIGPAGRVTLSNVEAIKGLSWDNGMLEEILGAWSQVEEIPEYPGSYYVSRSIYQSFWNVVNDKQNVKDVLMQFGKEADEEILRKWNQYSNR